MMSVKRTEFIALVGLLVIAAFFRLYRLPDTLHWRGDEGRDALIMRTMIITHHPVLIGPPTSITTDAGPLYLGPLTYYLMAPGLWLTGGDPIGPAVIVMFFSLATIIMLWIVGRTWFHPIVGWIAATIYTISPNAIIFGRHAWNPNFMPFFAVVTVWSIWQAWSNHRTWFWVVASGSLMAMVQSHPMGWALSPLYLIAWLLGLRAALRSADRRLKKNFWQASGVSIIVGLVVISPLVIFDASHHGYSWRVISSYLTHQSAMTGRSITQVAGQFFVQLRMAIEDTLTGFHVRLAWAIMAVLSIGDIFFLLRSQQKERQAVVLLGGWIIFSGLALALFNGPIFIQYRELLWPAAVLLVSWFAWRVIQPLGHPRGIASLASAIFLCLVVGKIIVNPTTVPPDFDYRSTKLAAKIISSTSDHQPYGLGIISARGNSDSAYRYVLTWEFKKPVDSSVAQQAYIICESTNCANTGEVQLQQISWPDAKVMGSWQLSPTVTIFKVIRPS